MKINIILYSLKIIFVSLILTTDCSSKNPTPPEQPSKILTKTNDFLVDSLATTETIALFKNLQELSKTKVLFGHQDDLAYGINWWAEAGRSDVKEVCGDYPAIYGWDLGDIHQQANLDGVDFNQMKAWIKEAYSRGGINTISLHLDNPVTAGNSWDNTPAVKAILPNRNQHAAYLKTLDLIANFLKALKTDAGIQIPIIFRPYHEHNHTWSWWGRNSCTTDEYNALWQMTVEYFRDKHQIHHLLYAISPQEANSETAYFARYPGDDYVDIFGLDYYKLYNKSFVSDLGKSLHLIATLAENRGKISALTEVGVERVPDPNWWTEYLLAALKYSEQSKKTAWALVWRNASKDHHFAPYQGHKSVPDFLKFYRDQLMIFENELPDMYR